MAVTGPNIDITQGENNGGTTTTSSKFNFETEDGINLYDSWANFDLASAYFTVYTFDHYVNSNGDKLSGILNPSTKDTWRLCIGTTMYNISKQVSCVAKGYIPTFRNLIHTVVGGSTVKLSRTDNSLTIGSNTYTADDFSDGSIPHALIFLVQGAGGGGGSSSFLGFNDGTGGGGGGFCSCVYVIEEDLTLTAGKGGASEEAGASSYIKLNNTTNSTLCFAYGGGAGRASTKSEALSGGSGGTAWVDTNYAHCPSIRTGGNGAKVYELTAAGGCDALNLYSTANTSDATNYGTLLFMPATTGGIAQGDSLASAATGGGGASMSANGANGGNGNYSFNGTKGSGGGGARWSSNSNRDGGTGGDGYIKIYY